MEKVTYLLGAGFSAPLGLPVMRNFLVKSKDLYLSALEKYKHFLSIFDVIDRLSNIKNYYDADLFNIEEILSIIEMGNFLEGVKLKKDFLQYITDVILYYTPPIQAYSQDFPSNWRDFVFGTNKLHSYYGYFVANLFNLKIDEIIIKDFGRNIRKFTVGPCDLCHSKYAVITLNYDLVLENYCEFINTNYINKENISFNREGLIDNWTLPPLLKLHGSADHGVIVPPTWAKGTTPQVTPTWKNAFQVLSESNHIRIIGYSLPIADAYIKYLLKSAVLKTKHLKSIDVICLDPDNSVKPRYNEFIKFNYFRFANINTDEYLKLLHDTNKGKYPNIGGEQPFSMNVLEEVHEIFMTTNSK